jgi:hypothetical protein
VTVSTRAPRQSCSWPFPSVKLALTHTSICADRGEDICRSLSSRQNPVNGPILRQRAIPKLSMGGLASIVKVQCTRKDLDYRSPQDKIFGTRLCEICQKITERLQQERHIGNH